MHALVGTSERLALEISCVIEADRFELALTIAGATLLGGLLGVELCQGVTTRLGEGGDTESEI